jgi:hypothetical protein
VRLSVLPSTFSTEHGLRGARSRACFTAHLRAAWEPSLNQSRSRGLNLRGEALLFAYARFGRTNFDAPYSPAFP